MLKETFLSWYGSILNFMTQSMPSKKWDERAANPQFQKEVAGSHTAQALYAYTEARITNDYALLIDVQLRDAFRKIPLCDISKASGFSDPTKASFEVKGYFDCSKTLEHFIFKDIYPHPKRDSQLHAFRRWIGIAKKLLNDNNYDATCLVLLRLSQINMELKLSKELPLCVQNTFDVLNELINPSKNFSALRNHIAANSSSNKFLPAFLIAKDITFINETLDEEHKNLKPEELGVTHPSYDNLVRKNTLLHSLLNTNQVYLRTLPQYLKTTFQAMSTSYQTEKDSFDDYNLPSVKDFPAIEPTNLYNKLLPTLFNRRGKSAESYWESTFEGTHRSLPSFF